MNDKNLTLILDKSQVTLRNLFSNVTFHYLGSYLGGSRFFISSGIFPITILIFLGAAIQKIEKTQVQVHQQVSSVKGPKVG